MQTEAEGELDTMTITGIPMGDWSGSNATDALHQTIREFNEKAELQTREMIKLSRWVLRLTWALVGLTVVMVAAVVVQIVLATE